MQHLVNAFPKKHKLYLIVAVIITIVFSLIPAKEPVAASYKVVANYTGLAIGTPYPLPLNIPSEESVETYTEKHAIEIKSGDSLATLFTRVGLTQKNMLQVANSATKNAGFTKLIPGQFIIFEIDENNELISLSYEEDAVRTIESRLVSKGKYLTSVVEKQLDTQTEYFEGSIQSNFWNAGVTAGLSENLIMNLANIFAWDVDMALDLRAGDSFSALVEKIYVEGVFVGYGDILAAEFVNQGDAFKAVLYEDGRYYAPDGGAMRKTFLRAPVNFKYISSNFSNRRFHPVQKRYKAHRGVDYAANIGTPVQAAGDGKVVKASYDRFNGHHVFIEHGGGVTTKYLHFSKRKVKAGQRVKQGQIIGLVGKTGLAAGPHLHYEFLLNGVHRNPRTVDLPKADPIAEEEKASFLALSEQRLSQLEHNKNILLAMR